MPLSNPPPRAAQRDDDLRLPLPHPHTEHRAPHGPDHEQRREHGGGERQRRQQNRDRDVRDGEDPNHVRLVLMGHL